MGKEMWAVLLGQHKGDTCQSCLLFLVWFQLSRLMIAKRNINKSLQPVHSGFVQCFSSSSAVYVNNTAHVLRKTLIHHSLQKMHMEKRHSQFLHLSANKMTLMVSMENQLWQPQHVHSNKSTGYSNKKKKSHHISSFLQSELDKRGRCSDTHVAVCVWFQGKLRKEDASNDDARLSSTSHIWHSPDARAAVQSTEHRTQHWTAFQNHFNLLQK